MSISSSSPTSYSYPTRLISIDPRIYCETINELHSYLTTCKRGYLTQAELFRYYRQRHDNAEIPYRLLGYRSLLDLLGSDQRLFTIDLRREPAHIYSAVKLRQDKREQRRMFVDFQKNKSENKRRFSLVEGSTSLTRQHHSTNTIDEQQQQHIPTNDYPFFDHHVPLNNQQTKENSQSNNEQIIYHPTENRRPLTPINSNHFDNKLWHTPELDQQKTLNENKSISNEENHQETIPFQSNPFLPLPIVHHSDNDYQLNKRSIIKDPSIISCSSNLLNRSISTSTTSLSNCKCSPSRNSSKIFFFILICSIFVLIYLYKTCFI